MSDVQRRLLDLVQQRTGNRPEPDARLASLGIDSIEMADFVGVLEKEFGLHAEADLVDVDSFAELARYIEAHS